MRDIDLPGSPQDLRTRYHEAALAHLPAIHECRGIARYEHEDLGRIAEAVIADGDPGNEIGGNMVEKNQPQRDPAEQIEPEIASGGDHRSMHRGNLA